MPFSIEPYDVLGVATTATWQEIRAAYRRQARRWHPDMPEGDPDAFTRLNLAYQYLLRHRQPEPSGESPRAIAISVRRSGSSRVPGNRHLVAGPVRVSPR